MGFDILINFVFFFAYRWSEAAPRAASCSWESWCVKWTGSASWASTYKHLPAPQHIPLWRTRRHRRSPTPCWSICCTCLFFWQKRSNSWVNRWVQINQNRVSFLFIHSFLHVIYLHPPGRSSAQSAGTVHRSALAPTWPLLVPEHSGIRQHPLPSIPAPQLWFCLSAAAEITA